MFNQNIDIVDFCGAVKYSSNKNFSCDYSTSPRPCHNLAFMLEGEGTIISDGVTLQIKKGDILYIPQNSLYVSNWKAEPNCIFHSLHFNFSSRRNPFYDKKIPVQLLPNNEFDELYKYVQIIQQYQYSKNLNSFLFLSAFYYLCGTLLSKAKINENGLQKSNIAPALLYLENNSTQPCTVEQLAQLCYLSPSRLFYLFKKQMGCTPITYKNKITIQKIAQELILHKDKSIAHIAREYGFESTIYFTRLFKKITGKTPSQFRKDETLM
jgi:AraC-like DNA-binding protein